MADDMKFCIETDYEYSPTLRTKPYSSEVNNCKHDTNAELAGYVDKYINKNTCTQAIKFCSTSSNISHNNVTYTKMTTTTTTTMMMMMICKVFIPARSKEGYLKRI